MLNKNTIGVSGSVTGTVTTNARFVPDYSAKTIICKNGLLTATDAEHYFKVLNTTDGQKIYARGLATEKGTADSGELYVSGNFIDAFKEFLSYMKNWVADVRSIGSNKDKADTMIGHCDTVISKLTDTSLIASS